MFSRKLDVVHGIPTVQREKKCKWPYTDKVLLYEESMHIAMLSYISQHIEKCLENLKWQMKLKTTMRYQFQLL